MYKLWNYLFGWDYILWENTAATGISRVKQLPDGTVGYWRYRMTNMFDVINEPKHVHWLTCKPDKYFK